MNLQAKVDQAVKELGETLTTAKQRAAFGNLAGLLCVFFQDGVKLPQEETCLTYLRPSRKSRVVAGAESRTQDPAQPPEGTTPTTEGSGSSS